MDALAYWEMREQSSSFWAGGKLLVIKSEQSHHVIPTAGRLYSRIKHKGMNAASWGYNTTILTNLYDYETACTRFHAIPKVLTSKTSSILACVGAFPHGDAESSDNFSAYPRRPYISQTVTERKREVEDLRSWFNEIYCVVWDFSSTT